MFEIRFLFFPLYSSVYFCKEFLKKEKAEFGLSSASGARSWAGSWSSWTRVRSGASAGVWSWVGSSASWSASSRVSTIYFYCEWKWFFLTFWKWQTMKVSLWGFYMGVGIKFICIWNDIWGLVPHRPWVVKFEKYLWRLF